MGRKEEKILSFLQQYHLAVIATSNKTDAAPESSLIAFVEDENFCLYFQTGTNTRKAHNLKQNPHVSLVVGLELEDMATLQYEGIATRLDEAESAACKKLFVAKDSPTTLEYLERPDAILFKINPKWISLADYSKNIRKPRFFVLEHFKKM